MENMTAKVSCFARAYHYKNNSEWVFKDDFAEKLLGEKMYAAIAENMAMGIQYFAPGFKGTHKEALSFIVNHQLAPSVLGRSAFCERRLLNEIRLGTKQYVLFAAGYDTYAFRNENENLTIFEIDLPQMISEKLECEKSGNILAPKGRITIPCDLADEKWIELLIKNGFDKCNKSYGSLLGISYYLTKDDFSKLLGNISNVFCPGSAICFDYPSIGGSVPTKKNESLAKEAGEEMKAKYTYAELEGMLADNGFLVYEHLDSDEMTKQFFESYNKKSNTHMVAPEGVEYILAVKK